MRIALFDEDGKEKPKTYTGVAKGWPAGLYQGVKSSGSFIIIQDNKAVFIRDGGKYMNVTPGLGHLYEPYRKLSDGERIVLTA